MEKETRISLKLPLVLYVSFFFNVLFAVLLIIVSRGPPELSWTEKAASEAEAVAAISCSGHGRAFLDGVIVNGEPSCECNTCYVGPHCSSLLTDCPADAESGNPLFLEPYWREHAASGTVVVSGWHRMSYATDGDYFISLELQRHIRLLHGAVQNAVTDGRFIIFGTGSTQLINAAVHALSSDAHNSSSVVASVPYYPMYKSQTDFFDSNEYEWRGLTSNWVNASISSVTNFIEFVTSPNNPDGHLKKSVLGGSSAIHDHVYYWPHYSAIPAPADEDIMLFSISKISGHASSRFGWAVIKDESVYQRMVTYLQINTMGVSRDTQLRVLHIIKAILAEIGGEGDIFKFGYKLQKERWNKLNKVISSSARYSLQKLSPQYCSYFKKIRDPAPAYAWLKCEMEVGTDCYAVLSDAGIISRGGSNFEADTRYTRLSLIKTQDDFDQLLQRLEAMVSKERVGFI